VYASYEDFDSARAAACVAWESFDVFTLARISELTSAALISANVRFCASIAVRTLLICVSEPGNLVLELIQRCALRAEV